ncbi:MAG TPA: hypothetical protein VFG97_06245 [Pedococcus sp.]|nr:hypothetical protein [Pedococcus sp.]
MTELRFADAEALADLAILVSRARGADPDGAVRLQAHGRTLAAYVGVLPGSGLMAEGSVIGLRTMALAEPSEADVTVSLGAVADRLARPYAASVLALPPVTVRAGWAAVAPPRSGWERVGAVSAEQVGEVARAGIQRVAQATEAAGGTAGAAAVTALRQQVWSEPTPTHPPFPSGGAFAAYVLGFVRPDTEVTVFAHGRWTRLSAVGGHVLIR